MFKKIVIVVLVLVGGLLAYAATRPGTLHVERSISTKARPEQIFPLVNDFHQWGAWSPYEKLDPNMKRTFSGRANGTGAIYEWAGNSNVGEGRMEIVDERDPSRVTIKLDFVKPFEGHNIAQFTIMPQGDSTNVTWRMDGPTPYLGKLIGVFMNMDTMIGKDFETGLGNLKALAEQRPASSGTPQP